MNRGTQPTRWSPNRQILENLPIGGRHVWDIGADPAEAKRLHRNIYNLADWLNRNHTETRRYHTSREANLVTVQRFQ